MNKSQRMKPVTQVAENRERNAARVLGESQRQLLLQESKLMELQAYRSEYLERLTTNSQSGMDARQMHDYRAFLHKLDQAIHHQQNRVDAERREYEKKKRQWCDTRTRMLALDKVVARYRHQENQVADRREQQETDERSLLAHHYRNESEEN